MTVPCPSPRRGARAAAVLLLALAAAHAAGPDASRPAHASDGAAGTAAAGSARLPDGALPVDVELVYRTTANVRLGGLPLTLHARTTTHWHRDGGRYDAAMHTDTIEFSQQSRGALLAEGGLAPTRYTEKRPFHDAEAVDIDWQQGRLHFGAAAPVAAPPPGAQDRLSLQFAFAIRLQRHPQDFAAGRQLPVQLIGPRAVDDWTFTCVGDEAVQTAQGAVTAVHLAARRPVRDTEETMDIWLDRQSYHLPVRIRMVDRNQSVIDSVLQSSAPGPD